MRMTLYEAELLGLLHVVATSQRTCNGTKIRDAPTDDGCAMFYTPYLFRPIRRCRVVLAVQATRDALTKKTDKGLVGVTRRDILRCSSPAEFIP